MEIRQLKTFLKVVEAGNMSLASKKCGLTQSAISLQIKALEDELGQQLFVRNTHEVRITDAGSALLPYANNIVNSAKEASSKINELNGKIIGTLNIGAGFAIEPFLRKAQCEMMKLYPDVNINIEYAKAEMLNERLTSHKIDLAFTMNQSYPSEGIVSLPLIPFHICCIMTKTHPLASKDKVTFADIEKFSVILPDAGERATRTIEDKMGYDIKKLKIRSVVNSAEAALNLIEETNYLTFLPCIYVSGRTSLTARPIQEINFDIMSNAHYMKDVYLKSSAKEFIRIIREYSIPYYKSMMFNK